ncbi:MAG: acyltransferase family protein [Myxococcales bacterium]|nr:acyltransferase family protein [Myxococcales bacterium]
MHRAFSLDDWRRRAAKHFRPGDFWRLGPGGLINAAVGLATGRDRHAASAGGLDARDPELVELLLDLSRFVGERYFRWKVQGVEHVPAEGPALLVGNHNGGLQTFDSLLTLVAIRDRFGPGRVVHPLAHDLLFHEPRLGELAVKLGTLRADHEAAREALRRGRLVLVYPGSDLDSTRRFADRHRIELGGRTGFVKLALRERVPIVPVVSVGTHEQFIVLSRGDGLARALGLKRWLRAEVFPIVLSLPWGLTSGFVPYIPLPAQTSLRFGPALRFDGLDPEAPASIALAYEQVREQMQAELDVLAKGRVPFLGDVREWLAGR